MKIALIDGSPKVKGSTSRTLLLDLKSLILNNAEVIEVGLHKTIISDDRLEELKSTDVWVFSFPLYVDGIPGHLLSCLKQLENLNRQDHKIYIYGIVNCGFYEGIQAELALELLSNWCIKIGFNWNGGIGVGGGGGLAKMPSVKNGHGPKAPIDKAIKELAHSMLHWTRQENNYVSVAFPRCLYKIAAQIGWRQMIKVNGGQLRDLRKQLK